MDGKLLTPEMQYGFAALCVMLIGVVVWLIKRTPSGDKLLDAYRDVGKAMTLLDATLTGFGQGLDRHEQVVRDSAKRGSDNFDTLRGEFRDESGKIRDKFAGCPCVKKD
jgi:hypothetical protein